MKLIDDYRRAWRLYSVRLAAVAGVLATGLSVAPGLLTWLVDEFLPYGPWRIAVSVLIGLVVFVIPTVVRLMPQKDSGDEQK